MPTSIRRRMLQIAAANEETHEAWNGVLFDRFVKFRRIVTTGLGAHGEVAITENLAGWGR